MKSTVLLATVMIVLASAFAYAQMGPRHDMQQGHRHTMGNDHMMGHHAMGHHMMAHDMSGHAMSGHAMSGHDMMGRGGTMGMMHSPAHHGSHSPMNESPNKNGQ
jgi:hypothetical protein